MYQRRIEIEDKTASNIKKIAKELDESENAIIKKALDFYCETYYCKHEAQFLNDNVVAIMKGIVDNEMSKINSRSNQLFSELLIQQCIIQQVLAHALEINSTDVVDYRKAAIDFIKQNQRVLRLDEVIE